MVGIVITDHGVEVDPLSTMDVHPAAELFPLMHGAEFDDLISDITTHGQREAIVLTPSGQLLDGRNRWRACVKAGVTPVTRVEESEPWAYVISTNVHRRHLTESQRAMIAARIAERANGSNQYAVRVGSSIDEPTLKPPTQAEAAHLLNIGGSSVTRAREVTRSGTVPLQRLVEDGVVPVYTAARVARELPAERQDEFVERVNAGEDPKKLAAALNVPSDWTPKVSAARTDNRGPNRHRHITVAALRSLRDSLDALDIVLKGTPDGLDPAITNEEAAHWVGDLSKGRGALRRVLNLLNERKEFTP